MSENDQNRRSLVASRIRQARIEAGYGTADLAEVLGVSRRIVQHWESGRYQPRFKNLWRLSRVLGRGYEWLAGDSPTAPSRGVDESQVSGGIERVELQVPGNEVVDFDGVAASALVRVLSRTGDHSRLANGMTGGKE